MEKKTIIATKVSETYRAEAHNAAEVLGTTVAAIIKGAMDKAIKRAAKIVGERK